MGPTVAGGADRLGMATVPAPVRSSTAARSISRPVAGEGGWGRTGSSAPVLRSRFLVSRESTPTASARSRRMLVVARNTTTSKKTTTAPIAMVAPVLMVAPLLQVEDLVDALAP